MFFNFVRKSCSLTIRGKREIFLINRVLVLQSNSISLFFSSVRKKCSLFFSDFYFIHRVLPPKFFLVLWEREDLRNSSVQIHFLFWENKILMFYKMFFFSIKIGGRIENVGRTLIFYKKILGHIFNVLFLQLLK